MNKRVIFIAGMSWSGTTLLDLMIGSGPESFSCGEVINLFRKDSRGMVRPVCSHCGEPAQTRCQIWKEVFEKGKKSLYETIFGMLPNVKTLTDSSKSISWFEDQTRNIGGKYDIYRLLIYKSPQQMAWGAYKRGRGCPINDWHNTHEMVLKSWKTPIVVSYKKLCLHPAGTLKKICDVTGIEYFSGKELYWNYPPCHMINGSWSARLHLYEPSSPKYNKMRDTIKQIQVKNVDFDEVKGYRTIYYSESWRKRLPKAWVKAMDTRENKLMFQRLEEMVI